MSPLSQNNDKDEPPISIFVRVFADVYAKMLFFFFLLPFLLLFPSRLVAAPPPPSRLVVSPPLGFQRPHGGSRFSWGRKRFFGSSLLFLPCSFHFRFLHHRPESAAPPRHHRLRAAVASSRRAPAAAPPPLAHPCAVPLPRCRLRKGSLGFLQPISHNVN